MSGVIETALAAFRENTYYCSDLGGTLRNGNVVADRQYTIGSGGAATQIKTFALDGRLLSHSILYADESGRRRVVNEWEGRPLIGADSVASRVFAAAAAAPCPKSD